jgi:hypothetical protein
MSGTSLTPTLTMSAHRAVTATFFPGHRGQRRGRADQLCRTGDSFDGSQ